MTDGSTTDRGLRRHEKVPTSPDPIEIAMEAVAEGVEPSGVAVALLQDQRRLIGWEIADRRAALALKVLAAVAGLLAAGAAAAMLWSASRADGLVAEPFSVPRELSERGLTGATVAQTVLDSVARLDQAANSFYTTSLSESWTGTSRIELPNTGVSLDDLDRLLRRTLGKQTYLTGEVVMTPVGLAITARTRAGQTVHVEGPVETAPALMEQLAAQLYASARPMNYVLLAMRNGDLDTGLRLSEQVLANGATSALDRARAHNQIANVLVGRGRVADALPHFRLAAGAPDAKLRATALGNIAKLESWAGHWQASYDLRRQSAKAESQPAQIANRRAYVLSLQHDFEGSRKALEPSTGVNLPGESDPRNRGYARYAAALRGLHRYAEALKFSAAPMDLALTAAAQQDWGAAADAYARAPGPSAYAPAFVGELAGYTARAGRVQDAKAATALLPLDCYECAVARAWVAEAGGDHPAADRWLGSATRLAPDNAEPWQAWGEMEMRRGAPERALERFGQAQRRSRHWADPLAGQGEALAKLGRWSKATAAYEAANRFAPRWGRLHLQWGEALAKLGKADEARAKWRAAATMDLTAAERAELARVQGAK